MSEQAQALALSSNWLDAKADNTFATNGGAHSYQLKSTVNNSSLVGGVWYNDYWYPYWNYSYRPRIELTLTEVEHLRTLAKNDKKLKDTLNKFTPWIQVVVDF